jgi:hypothetical protein
VSSVTVDGCVAISAASLADFLAVVPTTAIGGENLFLAGRSILVWFAVLDECDAEVLGVLVRPVAEKLC